MASKGQRGAIVNGNPVLSFEKLIEKYNGENVKCCIAIADRKVSEKLTQKCNDNGIQMRVNLF